MPLHSIRLDFLFHSRMAQIHPHLPTAPTHQCPQVFTVWKKPLFFGGTGFTVFDPSGNLLFQVETNFPSHFNRQLLLMDAQGFPLLTLRRKVLSLHRIWEGFISHGEKTKERIFSMKRSFIVSRRVSAHVFQARHPSRDYHLEGSFRERSCSIYSCSRSLVAEVKRKRASCDMLLEKDVFSVVVYPGFDPALIVSWIVILDHMKGKNVHFLTQGALRCLGIGVSK